MPGAVKKISYLVIPLTAVLAGGLAYFKLSPPSPSPLQAAAQYASQQQMRPDMPNGEILIPHGDGLCEMHALDNTTGQIIDYGVVKCSNASQENLDAWRRAMKQDRFVEVGKSFRHESDR